MPQIALRMRRRSGHKLLDVREEEILGLEEGRYLNDGRGAEDRRREGLRIEMEGGRRFHQELPQVSSEGAVGGRGPELHVTFDAVPAFGLIFKSVDARTQNGGLRVGEWWWMPADAFVGSLESTYRRRAGKARHLRVWDRSTGVRNLAGWRWWTVTLRQFGLRVRIGLRH